MLAALLISADQLAVPALAVCLFAWSVCLECQTVVWHSAAWVCSAHAVQNTPQNGA